MNRTEKTKEYPEINNSDALLNRMINRIRKTLELEEILSATAAEMRSFLQTDRVKIYRFQADGSGEVIAESRKGDRLPSLLGLHFPAQDIPPHIRELYIKARYRSIVDVETQQIILNCLSELERTENFTANFQEIPQLPDSIEEILQRQVEPCHLNYLKAMGVCSSLAVPILHQKQLWGLLISHHSEVREFAQEELQVIQTLADQLAIAIAQSTLLNQTRRQAFQQSVINEISTLLHSPLKIEAILPVILEKTAIAVQSTSARLFVAASELTSAQLYTYGIQPQLNQHESLTLLEDHPFWQALQHLQTEANLGNWETELFNLDTPEISNLRMISDLYQEPQLADLTISVQNTRLRGILVMALQYRKDFLGYLTLFRNDFDIEIHWAGYREADPRQARPRNSFETWCEHKRAQIPEWSTADIEMVQGISAHLSLGLMQNRLHQVEMHNLELKAARAAAEEANRLKSNFLASTSHELRTPLASTLNYLKLLKEGFYDNEEQLKKYLQVAYQSTENLVSIINDVLDIGKIEAGRMSIHLAAVHLRSLLEEECRLFTLQSHQSNIPILIECEVDWVYADEGKLRQVLTNLLSNAFKFTQKGEIRIKASQCNLISGSGTQPGVEISVIDTGIGIEMSKKESLFEPFVQADSSIKRRYGGTGLGLTICKRFVELMGGHIWLHSPGLQQGTTVTFQLPYPTESLVET